MCALECPSGVDVGRLMQNMKASLARTQKLRWVETVLSRGETMGRLGSRFGSLANAGLRLPGATVAMEQLTGVDRRRRMPPFAWGSSLRMLRRLARRLRPETPVAKVAYFLDLFAAYHDHELARAVVEVLTHNGMEVVIPDQKSAAMPMMAYGDLPAARRIIRYNLERLVSLARSGMAIVCSEPSAALCLKHEWPRVERDEQSSVVSEKAVELTDFLLGLAETGKLKTDFKNSLSMDLAYHAPCHLRSLHDRFGSQLVRLIPGAKVTEMNLSCCGIAGTYGFQKRHYDLSLKIGEPMLDAFKGSSAPYGLTECSTCRLQMESYTGKTVFHPIKLLAAAYGFEIRGISATGLRIA
jgi:Fe-S oxidoreductase